jgi:hypothetical protein
MNSSRHFRCKGEPIFNTLSDRLAIFDPAFGPLLNQLVAPQLDIEV